MLLRLDMVLEERWVGAEDVAAHLGVAKDSIYRWIEKRGLPAHRVGRLLRFKLSEIDEWVRRDSKPKNSLSSKQSKPSLYISDE
jgi:excisionase family DNA binding protein